MALSLRDLYVLDAPLCALGESPVWSSAERSLYWVDILGMRIHCWSALEGQSRFWDMPAAPGSLGLVDGGGLVVALKSGIHRFDPQNGNLSLLTHPEVHRPGNRYNDGKVSPDGRFFVGTMDDAPDKQPVASLYAIGSGHHYRWVKSGLKVSNGLAWSPDGRWMYHSDSRWAKVWRHSYDVETGAVGPAQEWIDYLPQWGRPDGAAVDAEGCYWSCGVSAGRINRFDPDGRLMDFGVLPVSHPTMPCFGGDGGKTLFITTLRAEVPPDILPGTPLAGATLAMTVDVPGVPVSAWRP
ncbi:SMP-30/gluconolactonase/LRE family protein [Amphibiibacter pelophylacis]|uniref:SMP-30/gluconolactonase/LRE family protein n=1 Tax=Amphibiibacter pelophylacis TaxID=1799477 RepID=A0ACC6P1M2_9BURK